MDKILIIDCHNQIWRACIKFGASKDEVDDSVLFTFNFFRNLRPLIEKFSPDKVFFALESHPKFRYDIYPEYKANRIIKEASKKDTNDTFHKTKNIVLSLLKYFPFTLCKAEGYEADDVIGALCDSLSKESVTVITNDSDYIQLLQKNYLHLKVYNPIKKEFMQAPDYPYVAWKCLNGDKSDNIKSLLKPKKALDCMIDPLKFKEFMSSEENRANFSINKKLIEFHHIDESEIKFTDFEKDFDSLKQQFINLKFESIVKDESWLKYCNTFNSIKF